MTATLKNLADLVGGALVGDGALVISDAAILEIAQPGQITLADSAKMAERLAQSQASAAVVGAGFAPANVPYISVEHPHEAFGKIVQHFHPRRQAKRVGVSPAANVSQSATLGQEVEVHAGVQIGDEVEIGDRCVIHSGVCLMAGCKLGDDVTVFPNVVMYEDTNIGDRCVIHANVAIGAYGFGYDTIDGRHVRGAQHGWVEIGCDVEIGACSTIDRGSYGPTVVGEGTKIDNLVMIAHNCRIGKHNFLCSQVGIAGSTSTGDYVVMAGQAGIRDHVHIGDGAVVGPQTGVKEDLPGRDRYFGTPALPESLQMRVMAAQAKLPEMRKQFRALQRQVEALTAAIDPQSKKEAA